MTNSFNEIVFIFLINILLSFLITFFILKTKKWHGKITLDDIKGVQKFHTSPTPRIGGFPIICVFLFTCFMLNGEVSMLRY